MICSLFSHNNHYSSQWRKLLGIKYCAKLFIVYIQRICIGYIYSEFIKKCTINLEGSAVAQWLKYCATNWKVAGSIPAGVSGFFIDVKSFRSHGVDSASKRNEYQEHFLGVKVAGA